MDGVRQYRADDGVDAATLQQIAERFSGRVLFDRRRPHQR